MIEMHVPHNA